MKNIFIFLFLFFFGRPLCSQSIDKLFYTVNDQYFTSDFTFVSDSGFLLTSFLQVDPFRPIISKLDRNYNTEWTKQFSFSHTALLYTEIKYTIEESNQGGYILFAVLDQESWIVKLDSLGNELWNLHESFNDDTWYAESHIEEMPSGEIILLKSYTKVLFLSKIASTGNVIWSKAVSEDSIGGFNPAYDFDILTDSSIIVIGQSISGNTAVFKFNPLGDVLWSKFYGVSGSVYEGTSVEAIDDGSVLIGGDDVLGGSFVMKLDTDSGAVLWCKELEMTNILDLVSMEGGKYGVVGDDNLSIGPRTFLEMDSLSNFIYCKKFNFACDGYLYMRGLKSDKNNTFLSYPYLNAGYAGVVVIKADTLSGHPCISIPDTVIISNKVALVTDMGTMINLNAGTYSIDTIPSAAYGDIIDVIDLCALLEVEVAQDVNEISIYPNPISGDIALNVEIKNSNSNRVIVLDLAGKIILDKTFNLDRFEISTGELSNGMYVLKFTDAKGNLITRKIIKE